MERVKFNYSMKNTPTSCKDAFLKSLIFSLERFIKLIRISFRNKMKLVMQLNNFGFKPVLTPPKNEHLNAFEEDLYELVRNIGFKRINTVF